MKKLLTCLIIILLAISKLSAYAGDLDSLKQKLQLTSDSLKGPIYSQIAAQYLNYDTVVNRNVRHYYQGEALNYTMLALHTYSSYNDSIGQRDSYNVLSKIYRSQHKYIQAKWFILQSNTISRQKHDLPNIIASLIELSAIKGDIKDYTLAMRDLNEALNLSVKSKDPKNESAVQVGYAALYRQMKDYDKASIAITRHEAIDDSIRKAEEDRLAMINKRDSVQIKKQDSVIIKKKVYTSSFKRGSKLSSARRIVSL
jgi:tetratricopeptide (TPR) repeat protein